MGVDAVKKQKAVAKKDAARVKALKQKKALDKLDELSAFVIDVVNKAGFKGKEPAQPLNKLFSSFSSSATFNREDNILDLAQKGDRKRRRVIVDRIASELYSELQGREKDVDEILENYYINYYGTIEDLTKFCSRDNVLFTNFLNKILIKKDAPFEDKCAKLAQVCFQEIWGLGPLDEFFNFDVDSNKRKIEELACSGPNQMNITVSGQKLKFSEINYDPDRLERLCKRLCKPAAVTLNKVNPTIETEFLDHSRVNVTGGNFTSPSTFNIRRHYPGGFSVEDQIKLGSSTWECEHFLDLYCKFHPRIIVCGGQSTGKSTKIREICARLPQNSTIVCAESAMELGLEKIKHLIVYSIRTGVLPPDVTIEKLFRFNADAIVFGEARSGDNVMAYKESCYRTDNLTCTSWHADSPESVLPDMAANLASSGYASSEHGALDTLAKGTDLIIFLRNCDESYGKYQGLRHISRICEVPNDPNSLGPNDKYRDIFKFDYDDMKLKAVQPISEQHQKDLLARVHNDEAKIWMERLSNGLYDL